MATADRPIDYVRARLAGLIGMSFGALAVTMASFLQGPLDPNPAHWSTAARLLALLGVGWAAMSAMALLHTRDWERLTVPQRLQRERTALGFGLGPILPMCMLLSLRLDVLNDFQHAPDGGPRPIPNATAVRKGLTSALGLILLVAWLVVGDGWSVFNAGATACGVALVGLCVRMVRTRPHDA